MDASSQGNAQGPGLSARNKAVGRVALVFGILFFTIFFAVGFLGVWFMSLQPMAKVLDARNWIATPCTITMSQVVSTSGAKGGTTYRVDIHYSYDYQGQSHQGSRYKFVSGSTSGMAGKQQIVSQYPVGSQQTCYVNPNDPTESVINRGLTADVWFGMIPMVFCLIGLGGITYVIRRHNRRASGVLTDSAIDAQRAHKLLKVARSPARSAEMSWLPPLPTVTDGRVVLRAVISPVGKVVGLLIATLLWNGIVSVFVFQVVKAFARGRPDWCMTLFIIPFVIVGVLIFAGFVHSILALGNPRPTIELDQTCVPVGGTLGIRWNLVGNINRITDLRMYLEGKEEATYTRGTNTSTDRCTFARLDILHTTDHRAMAAGRATVTIPADTMHSLVATRNRILWTLHIHASIPRWPDVDEEYLIVVEPANLMELL